MKQILFLLAAILAVPSCTDNNKKEVNKPEKQISFALENQPHSYYVEQAELWWKQIERDSTSGENWFNYYRACRNAQGTADWREDFVDESPYLRLGDDIVLLMERNIPNSFTYNYVKGSTGAVDPSNGSYLLKAYKMNPDFPGIQSAMVTYSVSTDNPSLRKEANKKWKELDIMNPGLIQYARHILETLEPDAILLTQHDNDTYPAWMLQDAWNLKPDILVLNIDFLLLKSFRERIFEELGIPPFELDHVDVNEYRTNWRNVVQHFLGHYKNTRPLYIGLTVSREWYKGFEDNLRLYGLTYKFSEEDYDVAEVNQAIYEKVWDLRNINAEHEEYYGNKNVMEMNTNYLTPLNTVYNHFLQSDEISKADTIRQIAVEIAERTNDDKLIQHNDSLFSIPSFQEPSAQKVSK